MLSSPGQVIQPRDGTYFRRVKAPYIDARDACALALAHYLVAARFVRWGGDSGENVEFRLCSVHQDWPEASVRLDTPSCSIIDTSETPMRAHNFVPTCLEDTWNIYAPNTVLWKLSETSVLFQVDFWLATTADREAVAAALPGLFSPGETQTGVLLSTAPESFCLPVRATLEGYQRMDTSASVYSMERRLQTKIRCDIDVCELRCVVGLEPRIELLVVEQSSTESITPPPSESDVIAPGCA